MSLSAELARIYREIRERGDLPRLRSADAKAWLSTSAEFSAVIADLSKHSEKPETHLLLVLRTLDEHDAIASASLAETSLVVTDPAVAGSGVRFTGSVVREMCESAKREIFVAGFAIAAGSGLEGHLASAAQRGCKVVVVAGAWGAGDESKGINAILKSWPQHLAIPECFVHRPDKGGQMHIKAVIVDGQDMLVGSANFTFSAVKNNFELGLRVRGQVAMHARKFLGSVAKSSSFHRVSSVY